MLIALVVVTPIYVAAMVVVGSLIGRRLKAAGHAGISRPNLGTTSEF
jgi:hypothetical protein